MKAPQVLSVAGALFLIGCHYYPRDSGAPPAEPCPKPNINTSQWQHVTVSECGIRLTLPEEYKYTGSSGVFGDNEWVTQVYRSNDFNFVEVDFYGNGVPVEKYVPPADAEGYQRCDDIINGHAVTLHSYREYKNGPNRRLQIYSVQADLPVTGGTVQIVSQTADRRGQEQILAAIRTLEFIPRSPRPVPQELSTFAFLFQLARRFAIPWTEYFVVLAVGAYFVVRRKARQSGVSAPRRRALVAAYFALLLTPGVVTEFSTLQILPPALFDFFTYLPSLFYVDLAEQIYREPLEDVIRMLLSFALLYGVFTIYVRLRAWRKAPSS